VSRGRGDGKGESASVLIDDALLRDALRATGLKDKRQVAELGLQTLLRLHAQQALRKLRGTLRWQGDLEEQR
jgi:Arc/MetJ family transcription regulator